MVIFPNSKINIGLQIVRKRSDGFHDINTVFYPIPWNDVLEIIIKKNHSSDKSKIRLDTYGLPINDDPNNNLIVKAYRLLERAYDIPPVEVKLLKTIPMGAGLGGGSADAAFFLNFLNNSFELGIPYSKLLEIATILGSDCAFFLENKPVYARGRGEIFSDINLDLKGKFLIVVFPDVMSNTALAFKNSIPKLPDIELKELIENTNFSKWKGNIKNDFESNLFERFPVISRYKELFYESGAFYASMSGSGSAVYGLFDQRVEFEVFSPSHQLKSCFL